MNGGSGANDILQWAGFLFLILSGTLLIILCSKIFVRDYLRNKSRTLLFFFMGAYFMGIAILFLAAERIFIFSLQDLTMGLITAYIAAILSFITILFLAFFAFYATYPNYFRKSSIIAFILVSILIGSAFLSIPDFQINSSSGELDFPFYFDIILYLIGGPLIGITIGVLGFYSYKMKSKSPPHSKRAAWLAFSGILIFAAYIPEIFGFYEIINYSRSFYVPAVIIAYICFSRFIELKWPEKIHHLYLIHQDKGISLFNYSFIKEDLMDSQLVGGGITGVAMLLQELTRSHRKMRIIDMEDLKILMEYGKYVIAALMTEENYRILRKKLSQFVRVFENQYENTLKHFTGDVSGFEKTKNIVDEVFHYEEIF